MPPDDCTSAIRELSLRQNVGEIRFISFRCNPTIDETAIRHATRLTGMATRTARTTRHPPPEISLPSFLCRPLLVNGIPMRRDSRALAAERPTARFHEK